ncbi:MAG TPA: ATP-grasp domain-containing protein [Mycobacterium sp.]|nr:ATP-grasp domain-containing protein [Mycobacterium sp.]
MTDADSAPPRRRTRVMVLGAGQLGAELIVALQRLGAEVIAAEPAGSAEPAADTEPIGPAEPAASTGPAESAAAGPVGPADQTLAVQLADADELSAAITRVQPDVVVAASDQVAVAALRLAAQTGTVEVVPNPRSVRLSADREEMRRLVTDELGLPTVPFWFAGSAQELAAVADQAGYPLVVSPVGVTVPGAGQSVLVRPDDVEPAWERAIAAGGPVHRVLGESVVQVDYEITQLVAARDDDTVEFCAPIGHRRTADGRGLESWQPQPMSEAALDAARSVAARLVRALGGRGLVAVELAVRDDEVYFRDATVFPADSGLVTLRTQRLSQFELAARAVFGLASDTVLVSPGAAWLHYRGDGGAPAATPAGVGTLAAALQVPESDLRIFGPGSRAGVALATAGDGAAARSRVATMAARLTGVFSA